MKKITPIILILIFLFSGCSPVKLMDSWKSADFQSVKRKKILIAAKSPDLEIRKSYEIAITEQLRSQGIDAVAMYKTFPGFERKENPSQEEIDQIIKQFTDQGISSVLVTSLKNTIEARNSNTPQRVDIPTAYRGKYFLTFNNADDVHALPKLSAIESQDPPTVELKSTTYVLEAVTYDLTLEKEKQLISVSVVNVTDPSSAKKVLQQFSKIAVGQFK